MREWSIARRAALWFGGLLLGLLLVLAGVSYWLLSSYMRGQLDDEVQELGMAAASQLDSANLSEAETLLRVLVSEGTDLEMGFVFERGDDVLRVGRAELALYRPSGVSVKTWRRAEIPLAAGALLRVGIDGAGRAGDVEKLPGVMAMISVLFAAIAGLAGWLFGMRMSSLLADVAGAVDPAGARAPAGAPREISELVNAINEGFIRAQEEQSRSKLLIVGAAHALRSPIQALLSQAQSTLRRERDGARYRGTLVEQEQELIEFARSVDNLVTFCAGSGGDHATERFDFMSELRMRLQPDEDRAHRFGVQLLLEGPSTLIVEAEREAVVLAVRNLVSNALSVSSSGQKVRVSVEEEAGRVRVTADDEGPGVAEAERELVFEPMRRGSRASLARGSGRSGRARYGLGLALVRRAMGEHDGRAWIEDSPMGGARVCLEFCGSRPDQPRDSSAS